MILPTKHVSAQHSLLGAGATILQFLDSPQTVTSLWERVRVSSNIEAYGRFILALDLLFAVGALDLSDGLIMRRIQ